MIEAISFELMPEGVLVTYNTGAIEMEDYSIDKHGGKYFDLNNINRQSIHLN